MITYYVFVIEKIEVCESWFECQQGVLFIRVVFTNHILLKANLQELRCYIHQDGRDLIDHLHFLYQISYMCLKSTNMCKITEVHC